MTRLPVIVSNVAIVAMMVMIGCYIVAGICSALFVTSWVLDWKNSR